MADTLTLRLAEDAYQGDAQFTVDVDGVQIAGPTSVTALHSNHDVDTFTYTGDFGPGPHAVSINFINDAYGGTTDTDRNLYVEGITYNGFNSVGRAAAGGDITLSDPTAAALFSNGTATFTNEPESSVPPGPDTLVVYAAASTDPNKIVEGLTVTVDGKAVDITGPLSMSNDSFRGDIPLVGYNALTFSGDFGPGPHTVDVHFNDYFTPDAGAPPGGFTLYGIDLNGQHYNVDAAENDAAGSTEDPRAITGPSGDVVFRNVAEGTPTPDVTINATYDLHGGPGDDLLQGGANLGDYGGAFGGDGRDTFVVIAGTGDKTLHVQAGSGGDIIDLVGYGYKSFDDVMAHMSNGTLTNPNGETIHFIPDNTASGSSTTDFTADNFILDGTTSSVADQLVLHVSEDAWSGDAEFAVRVDGKQVGIVQTTTASHAQGQVQNIALVGHFGTGPHTVDVQFLNDAYGGTADTDRNLYVEGITYNGTDYSGQTAANSGAGPDTDPNAAEVFSNGTVTFSDVGGSSPPPPPPPSGPDTLVVYGSGLVAGIVVTVDGKAVNGPAGISSPDGELQLGYDNALTFSGDFGPGPHTVDIHYDAEKAPQAPPSHFELYGIDLNGQHYNVDAAENDIPGSTTDPRAISGSNSGDVIFRNVAEGTPTPDVTLNGHEAIWGGPGGDLLQGSPAAWGGAGSDTFVVFAGDGSKSLHFQPGSGGDVVDLVGYGYTSFADVMAHMTAISGGSQLTNPNGETISFVGDGSIAGSTPTQPTPDTFTADNFILDGSTSSVADHLVVHVSEDAWNGNAEFAVLVDGKQVGTVQTTTASHAQGQTDDISLVGHFGAGPHSVEVDFLNDAWGGSASTDRNLYVQGITFDGTTYAGNTATDNAANGHEADDPSAAVMDVNGSAVFSNVGGSSPPPPPASSTLVLHVSEDAFQGDAQFLVFVDGVQQGGVQTTTASHSAGQVQDITLTGDYGAQGPGTVDIQFLNDAYGGSPTTDRNLYVQGIDVNGVHFDGNTAIDNAANGHEADDPTAAVMDVNGTAEFQINHTAPPPDMMM